MIRKTSDVTTNIQSQRAGRQVGIPPGTTATSEESDSDQKITTSIVQEVVKKINKRYPKSCCILYKIAKPYITTAEPARGHILPDAGCICLYNTKEMLMMIEHKYQNDGGNAVERAYKYHNAIIGKRGKNNIHNDCKYLLVVTGGLSQYKSNGNTYLRHFNSKIDFLNTINISDPLEDTNIIGNYDYSQELEFRLAYKIYRHILPIIKESLNDKTSV